MASEEKTEKHDSKREDRAEMNTPNSKTMHGQGTSPAQHSKNNGRSAASGTHYATNAKTQGASSKSVMGAC